MKSVVEARVREAQGNVVTVTAHADARSIITQTTFLFVCIPKRHLNVTRTGQAGHKNVRAGDGQPAWCLRTRLTFATGRKLRQWMHWPQIGMDRIGLDRIG